MAYLAAETGSTEPNPWDGSHISRRHTLRKLYYAEGLRNCPLQFFHIPG